MINKTTGLILIAITILLEAGWCSSTQVFADEKTATSEMWAAVETLTAQLSSQQQQYAFTLIELLLLQHTEIDNISGGRIYTFGNKPAQEYDDELLRMQRSELDHQLNFCQIRAKTAKAFESLQAPPGFQHSHAVFASMAAQWIQAANDYAALQTQSANISSPHSAESKDLDAKEDMTIRRYPYKLWDNLEVAWAQALLEDLRQVLNQPFEDSDEEIRWATEYLLSSRLSSEDVNTLRHAPEVVRYQRLLVYLIRRLVALRDYAEQPELSIYQAISHAPAKTRIDGSPICKEVPARRRELIAYFVKAEQILRGFSVPELFKSSHQKYLNFLQERRAVETQGIEKLKPVCEDLGQTGPSGSSARDVMQQAFAALHDAQADARLTAVLQDYDDELQNETRQFLAQRTPKP